MYMHARLGVNCWQIFRRSPKTRCRQVVTGMAFQHPIWSQNASSRKELANAIRALSMDAVQKASLVTRVPRWYG